MLADEDGADVLVEKFSSAIADESSVTIFMHKLNLLEVYYDVLRRSGVEAASLFLDEIKNNPITIVSDITDDVFKVAGRLKASYSVSLADTFALALTITKGARLITSDHHEFDLLEKKGEAEFLWIR